MSQIRWLTRSGESEILCVGVFVLRHRGALFNRSWVAGRGSARTSCRGERRCDCCLRHAAESPASTWFAAPVVSRLRAPWFGSGRLLAIARHGGGA